ncbi:MAG: alpha-ketoacid dehydrogenase subunit beta [Candidatus Brocadiia bacterium]|nr:alpha-ketoacid dehydrogenase subunit beta [Candidatus Brocadiia bacterium]
MRKIAYRQAIREAMAEEMIRDERVFLMGEDVGVLGGVYGVSKGLLEQFGPERILDTPLAEAAIAGGGLGAALVGMRPIVEIMTINFMTIAMDQTVNQAAKMRYIFGGKATVPLVIRTQGGGGRNAAAHHSQSLEAWFVHVPGLKVVMPSTAYDVKGLLKTAIRDDNPVMFIEHILLYNTKGPVPEEEYTIPLGRADIKREGTDITVVATSLMVRKALKAAEELEAEGISLEIVDPRTLVPMDTETILTSVRKTGRLLVVHEACRTGGIAGEIIAVVVENVFDCLKAPPARVAALDVPIPYSTVLEKAALPDEADIAEAAKAVMESS